MNKYGKSCLRKVSPALVTAKGVIGIAALLTGALAQATDQQTSEVMVTPDDVQLTELTVYPRQGVVSQTLKTVMPAGLSMVKLWPDFDNWLLESLSLMAKDGKTIIPPSLQFWRKPVIDRSELIGQLVGQNVELFRPGRDTPLTGVLQSWSGDTGLLLLPNSRQEIFQWQDNLTLRTVDSQPLSPDRLHPVFEAEFNLRQPINNMHLTYLSRGLGYSNQYRLVTHPETSVLDVNLAATISNGSKTNYENASLQLASGDAGGSSSHPGQYLARSKGMMMSEAMSSDSTVSERAGDLLFLGVPGKFNLPAGGALNVPLIEERGRAYSNQYRYSFYGQNHPGSRVTKGYPVRTLTFTADGDLPAGPVQVYEESSTSPIRLVHQASIPQTAGGNQVQLMLGQSYAVTIERSRIARRQEGDLEIVDWQLKVASQSKRAVRLNIEDTANDLVQIDNLKGLKREAGLITAIIPAAGTQILSFRSSYRKK